MPPRIIRVIDFETTGTPEDANAEVIEMGRVDIELETGKLINGWCTYCKPTKGPIPPTSMAIHHIRDDEVAHARPAALVWETFFAECGFDDILAAHNAKFEQHFHDGGGRRWIDTYKCALSLWPDAPGHGNQVLRYWLGLEVGDHEATPVHAALPDAYVTAHILLKMLEFVSIDDMVKVSKKPAFQTYLRFGKHKGERYDAAPVDYLMWLRDKSDMGEDVKYSATRWLKKRNADND